MQTVLPAPFLDKPALESLADRYPDSKVLRKLRTAGNISLEEWERCLNGLGASLNAAEHLEQMIDKAENSKERSLLIEICQYLVNNFSNLCWYYRTYKKRNKLLLNIYANE